MFSVSVSFEKQSTKLDQGLTLNRPGGGGAESAHRLVLASAVLKR